MSVLVSTPYREASIQHLAQALSKAGMLEGFLVPLDLTPVSNWLARSSRLDTRLGPVIRKRCFLPPAASVAPGSEMLFTPASRLAWDQKRLLAWRARRLDHQVARRIHRVPASAVVGMPYASLETFQRAKHLGIPAFFNHVSADLRVENEAFREEAASAATRRERDEILRELWPESVIARVEQEIDLATSVLCPAETVREDLMARGVSADKIRLIPYGVDCNHFSAVEPTHDSRELHILYVGQIGVRKGLRYFADALRRITFEPSRVTVIGPVVNRSAVLARHLQGVDYHEVASRDELREHYRRADVFVLPSLAEGMALVVLEAMAAGLPVVVTEESGYRGVVRHGLEGLVVPARSGQAIAKALDVLSESGELRRQMGLAARRRAEEYDWQRFESAVTESFRTLVPARG